MATESCPKCGEKAFTQTGHCVFCGAVVRVERPVANTIAFSRAMKIYRLISPAFLVLGILYFAFAIIGTVVLKSPMLGLFIAGTITMVQGILLILNNEWVRSVTKTLCMVRAAIFAFMVMILAPYMLHLGLVGSIFMLVFLLDLACLVLMIRTIDDVYFA